MHKHEIPKFTSARLWFFPAAVACLRLQELRRRSRGKGGSFTLAGVQSLNPSEAAHGFAMATAASLGHFGSASPEVRVRITLHVLSYVQVAQAMDGLESLMLSGIDACHCAGAFAAARQGMAMWNHHVRVSNAQRNSAAVFLGNSQRIGFIGGEGGKRLLQFAAFETLGTNEGTPSSVFSPRMAGGGIGQQIASAMNGGFEQMDGGDFCHSAVKVGGGIVGGLTGAIVGAATGAVAGAAAGAATGLPADKAGIVVGIAGGVGGAIAGANAGADLAAKGGDAICGGVSPAAGGTRDGTTVVGDPADEGSNATYIGEVDDPNFIDGGTSGSNSQGTYVGEVDDPNFVSGGTGSGETGGGTGSGDTSGGTGSGDTTGGGSGSGDTSGGGGSGSGDTSGGVGSGDTSGAGGGTSGGMDNPEADPSSRGGRPGPVRGPTGEMANPETTTDERPKRGPGSLVGMDNPETGTGEGPARRGFYQGGFAVTTQTFATVRGLQGSIRRVTPALFELPGLPLSAESSIGAVLLRPGLLRSGR